MAISHSFSRKHILGDSAEEKLLCQKVTAVKFHACTCIPKCFFLKNNIF